MKSLDVSTPAGETLSFDAGEENVVIAAGDGIHAAAKVDVAARIDFRILHHRHHRSSRWSHTIPSRPESGRAVALWINAAFSNWMDSLNAREGISQLNRDQEEHACA